MKELLNIITIILSIAIVLIILIQGKGAGLGSAWGGSGEMFQTRRGIEKWTLRFAVGLIFIFFIISVINLLI